MAAAALLFLAARLALGGSAPLESLDAGFPAFMPVDTETVRRELVERGVWSHREAFYACVKADVSRSKDAGTVVPDGKLVVRFTLGIDGAVTAATLVSATPGLERLGNCVVHSIQAWRFPEVLGEVRVVTYPFEVLASPEDARRRWLELLASDAGPSRR